mmetsp:Transcript_13798/g.27926  ORF Transcript_13798/g.27926 Transcript_13798/m.27926 type:complete len:569 (-) Transcript_13798:245-1951(-)
MGIACPTRCYTKSDLDDDEGGMKGSKRLRESLEGESGYGSIGGEGGAQPSKRQASGETKELKLRIELLPIEKKIFDAIKEMLREESATRVAKNEPPLKLTVRVAGGWVRDKCIGKESDDIDLALDHMMGYEFAELMNKYLVSKGATKQNIGRIKANPEKSKHLETATFAVFGIDIDVNNLRTELYDQDSRIPMMKFGTAMQDAERRDFTMNALFYNIHTDEVEDLTGRGIDDLKNGILRTPLEPLKTFKDDPLRVLRAIRFAARFEFKLTEDLIKAAKNPAVKKDLAHKCSRERFGQELIKVVGGVGSPSFAFELLVSFNLHDVVFEAPSTLKADEEVKKRIQDPQKHVGTLGLDTMKVLEKLLRLHSVPLKSRRAPLYGAFLFPFNGYLGKVKKKYQPAIRCILRDSVKSPDSGMAEPAARLVSTAQVFENLATAFAQSGESKDLKRETGIALSVVKDDYKLALYLSYAKAKASEGYPSKRVDAKALEDIRADFDQHVVHKFGHWLENESGLIGCWKWKPLVVAKELMKEGIKGRALGEAMKKQVIWRYENPRGTKEELLASGALKP